MAFKQVDVSGKPISYRQATAVGTIRLKRETLRRIRAGGVEKGDPVALARLTGVLAAKQTPTLLALCHQLRLDNAEVTARVTRGGVEVSASVTAHERTGVEMEALTAVAVALLNVWDAVKQYEKDEGGQYPDTEIVGIRVTRKVKRPVEAS